MNTHRQPVIINLSSQELTTQQINLLQLGLKFTPTPPKNPDELIKDTKEFTRKLRLGEYFLDRDENNDGSIVKNKSDFMPPRGRNLHLDKCIDHLHASSTAQINNNNSKPNISHNQQQALKELQNNRNIIIKEADKGGAIVIMDRDYYEEKITEMLADMHIYTEIPNNVDKTTLAKIRGLISHYESILTEKEKNYLTQFENQTSQFYGLPKVHKSKEIIQAIGSQQQQYVKIARPTDLKFRPIVAGPCCPTHRLSNLLDIILKPFLQHTKSYIRDDIDFLTKLPTRMNESETFVTFDINSLYSNISNSLGLEAIEYWLHQYPESLHPRMSKEFIRDSIKVILENNSFCFGTRHFLQKQGTAMGTKMAPTYANLTLAYLEKTLYNNIRTTYTEEIAQYVENSWKRYIDDCFIIWDRNVDEVETLHSVLNSLNSKLTFTMDQSDATISFLDIQLIKQGETIITDIFHKPTDTKQYLHFRSCHPRSTKHNIPYNLARRICTIVTEPSLRNHRLQEMKNDLMKRGYPAGLIQNGIEKASSLSIETLRTPKPVTETNACAFVSTFNPNNKNMCDVIHNSLDGLQADTRCKRLVDSISIINSKRQPPNLKKMLTRARFEVNTPTVSQCGDKRCGTCPLLITGDTFTFKNSHTPFHVKVSMNCGTQNVIYVLQCQGCYENYIGQTSDTLRTRIRVHKQQIHTPEYRKIAVSRHIAECAGDMDISFKVFPFYKVLQPDKIFREVKEQSFIKKFRPFLNSLTYV